MVDLILAFFLWVVAAAIGIGNSFLADALIAPLYGEYGSHLYKMGVLIVLFFILSWIFARQSKGTTWGSSAFGAGFLWAGLSVIFHLILKRFVLCPSSTPGTNYIVAHDKLTECLTSDYNIGEGRILLVVLAFAFITPLLMGIRYNR